MNPVNQQGLHQSGKEAVSQHPGKIVHEGTGKAPSAESLSQSTTLCSSVTKADSSPLEEKTSGTGLSWPENSSVCLTLQKRGPAALYTAGEWGHTGWPPGTLITAFNSKCAWRSTIQPAGSLADLGQPFRVLFSEASEVTEAFECPHRLLVELSNISAAWEGR